ncbi:MAG TPA: alpha/beta hydrolase [Anaerolineaceae bacterium]|nr:alpha/beta hydrolase [Anaerolineaceae bacterium]
MPSFRSRLFTFALKNRHLLQGRWKPTATITWETSIPNLRQETGKGSGLMGKLPEKLQVTPFTIGEMNALWLLPSPQAIKDKVILYFHGGGYVIGSAHGHLPITAKFVLGSDTGALLFDYRLAPEHPFPAGLEDALSAYRYLLGQGIHPDRIVFMGDSAGGGLCLATLLAARDQGLPLPAAAVALSPWTDLKNTGESYETNAKVDTLTWRESQVVFSKYYVGEQDPGQPWISPLYGDLRGLPPLLIFVGGDELLRDDSTRFAEKAQQAGVEVTLRVGAGMFHCYPACAPAFPEATQALEEICGFIRAKINHG